MTLQIAHQKHLNIMRSQQIANAEIVCIERIVVKRDRITCFVCFPYPNMRYTTPHVAEALLQRLPNLSHHACVNECGNTFGAVIKHTSLPHVLEHLVIDVQVGVEMSHVQHTGEALCTGKPFAKKDCWSGDKNALDASLYVGISEWIDENTGSARIEFSFIDDLVALRALRDAADILNRVCGRCAPDFIYE